ncbi:MAG TPA: hypothetical protein VEH04_04605 [Verrucomicrobiae bacterium]|nr:hypothetical protein [Verrucomicrobiae bacterium]
MSTARVIQLRQLLREKIPQARLGLDELTARPLNSWATGIAQLDDSLHGGLPRGALTEIIAPQRSSGSALLRNALVARAAAERQIVAYIDGHDSLDVTALEPAVVERLLWVRCRTAEEALKAGDLILRDRNVPLVILDLVSNPTMELRRIGATTWFRFQRILEMGSTVCVVLTPEPRVSPAQARITIRPQRRNLAALDRESVELISELKLEVSDARRLQETNEQLQSLA